MRRQMRLIKLIAARKLTIDQETLALLRCHALLGTPDSDERSRQRKEAVRHLLLRAFAAAVFYLGDTEARQFWAKAARRRAGVPKGSRKPAADSELLGIYDMVAGKIPGIVPKLPRQMGNLLNDLAPGQFGQSADAIARQVRRLLQARRQQAEEPSLVRLANSRRRLRPHRVLPAISGAAAGWVR